MTIHSIQSAIQQSLDQYLKDLNGQPCDSLYRLIINEAEASVIRYVLTHTNYNQSRSAQMLGITRNTLKKKVIEHNLSPSTLDEKTFKS